MSEVLNIWPEIEEVESDKVKYSFTLEFPNSERDVIWYQVPIERKSEITGLADPFLVSSIFFAMALKTDIHVHGSVSRKLLENLEEYQAIWNCWKPKEYSKVSLFADHEIIPNDCQNDGAIIPFSGGVDSCFSVYSHVNHLRGRRNKNIEAALMVHGFDIPLSEKEKFRLAARKSAETLEGVGIPIICISTNWRTLEQKYKLNWEDCHASAIIS